MVNFVKQVGRGARAAARGVQEFHNEVAMPIHRTAMRGLQEGAHAGAVVGGAVLANTRVRHGYYGGYYTPYSLYGGGVGYQRAMYIAELKAANGMAAYGYGMRPPMPGYEHMSARVYDGRGSVGAENNMDGQGWQRPGQPEAAQPDLPYTDKQMLDGSVERRHHTGLYAGAVDRIYPRTNDKVEAERRTPDGAVATIYRNGTRSVQSADGRHLQTVMPNGDRVEENLETGTKRIIYARPKANEPKEVTTTKDGEMLAKYPDGEVVRTDAKGKLIEVVKPADKTPAAKQAETKAPMTKEQAMERAMYAFVDHSKGRYAFAEGKDGHKYIVDTYSEDKNGKPKVKYDITDVAKGFKGLPEKIKAEVRKEYNVIIGSPEPKAKAPAQHTSGGQGAEKGRGGPAVVAPPDHNTPRHRGGGQNGTGKPVEAAPATPAADPPAAPVAAAPQPAPQPEAPPAPPRELPPGHSSVSLMTGKTEKGPQAKPGDSHPLIGSPGWAYDLGRRMREGYDNLQKKKAEEAHKKVAVASPQQHSA